MPLFSIEDAALLTPEELAVARARQRTLWLRYGTALAMVVAGIFTARPLVHAGKRWQARRLASQALVFIDREQWQAAHDRATDASAIQSSEPMAMRAVGRLLARTRHADALPYYRQLRDMNALTREDRRDFSTIALITGAMPDAIEESDWLLAHPIPADAQKTTPSLPATDLLLAAQVASASGHERTALDLARRVLAQPAASESEQFTAAVRLVNAAANHDPDGPAAAPAWERLRHLAGSRGPVGLEALTLLSRRPTPLADKPVPPGWMAPGDIARALENHPLARAPAGLLALDLIAGDDPTKRAATLDLAVAHWRDRDDADLAALADWLMDKGETARSLDVLPATRVARNPALYLRRLNALAALGQWDEVKSALAVDDSPLEPISQHMYLAAAYGHLGDKHSAAAEWSLAREVAGRDPNRLYTLGQYAEREGAPDTAAMAYAAAIAAAPRMLPAHEAFCRLADSRGQTAEAQKAMAAMLEIWPQDDEVTNTEGYLRLLLGASGDDARVIEKTAAALVSREPGNWQARATLSLARLRQGKVTDALQAFAGLRAADGGSTPPGALAVRAAALAAAGWKDEARKDALALTGTRLRPEERVLVAPLVTE